MHECKYIRNKRSASVSEKVEDYLFIYLCVYPCLMLPIGTQGICETLRFTLVS
jgi:hypothetical protein